MILVATDHGVILCEQRGQVLEPAYNALAGHHVTSVVAREGVMLAGTRDGVQRSDDSGRTWTRSDAGLSTRLVRWMAFHPDISDREFAGVEPAGIFVSHDGSRNWRACDEVVEMRERGNWFLPYSPEAGCVRGFDFHKSRGYAAVEVGGVLKSDDGGETWTLPSGSSGRAEFETPPEPFVHSDVHTIAGHPSSPDLAFAATAEGLYTTHDGGETWKASHRGSYCRALWVDPDDRQHIVLGPADSVQTMNGRIEETMDGGETWRSSSEGLDLPWPHTMIERFMPVSNQLLAITNDGRLFHSSGDEVAWSRLLEGVEGITAVSAVA